MDHPRDTSRKGEKVMGSEPTKFLEGQTVREFSKKGEERRHWGGQLFLYVKLRKGLSVSKPKDQLGVYKKSLSIIPRRGTS